MDDDNLENLDLDADFGQEAKRKDPKIRIEDGFIIIDPGFDYNIPIKSCQTENQIIGWIIQLSGKNWASPRLIRKFIAVATAANGVTIHGYSPIRA